MNKVQGFLDPRSKTGMPIFLGHQKKFLKKRCHYGVGDSESVIMARAGLFSKIYRIIWLRVLESKPWSSASNFLCFIDYFSEQISKDEVLIKMIDDIKWEKSKELDEDAFFDFVVMREIGKSSVLYYVMDHYFPPMTSIEEVLLLTA